MSRGRSHVQRRTLAVQEVACVKSTWPLTDFNVSILHTVLKQSYVSETTWGRYRRMRLISTNRTNCLLQFSGDDNPLWCSTFHEARGAGRTIAQRLPSDGYDAEGTLRFSQTPFRRKVCQDSLYMSYVVWPFLVTNKKKQTVVYQS